MKRRSFPLTLATAILATGFAASPIAAAEAAQPRASIGELGRDGYLLLPQGGQVGLLAPQEVELIRGKTVKARSGESIGTIDGVVVRSGTAQARIDVAPELGLDYTTLYLPTDELHVLNGGLLVERYDLAALRRLGAPANAQ
jgi:hypothetical protein